MSNISRRLAKLEKTVAKPGRFITMSVPYGQEDEDHSHLLPDDITDADFVVMVINYANAAVPGVSVAPN